MAKRAIKSTNLTISNGLPANMQNLNMIGIAAEGNPAILSNGNIVLMNNGDVYKLITNFEGYERVGMNDAVKVGDEYVNLWDQLYKFSESRQDGRYLIVDKKYIEFIEMWSTHFGEYAGLTLKEFLI